MFFGEYRCTFLLGIYQKVGLLDYRDMYVQFLQILSSSYPKWFHHYTLSLAMYGKCYLLHIIADIWHRLFHFSHSGCYALVYHNGLICVSLVTKEIEHLFIFLWTVWISPCIYSIFLPVFSIRCWLFLIDLWQLFLYSIPLSDICIANDFSHSAACFVALLIKFLDEQRVLTLL